MDIFDRYVHVLSLLQCFTLKWHSKNVVLKLKKVQGLKSFFSQFHCSDLASRFLCEWPPKNGSSPQGAKEPLRNFY